MHAQRNLMVDVLKGLGIISVIVSHVYRGGTDPLAVFIREITMWCVPMFFMVQGYYMSGPQNYWQSSWKKIKKNYIPYLYWAVFYGLFFWVTRRKAFTVTDLILGKTALHLYYMFYYMVFALLCPLLYLLPWKVRIGTLFFMLFSNIAVNLILEISRTYQVSIISWSGPNPLKWWGFIAIGMLVAEYPSIKKYIREHSRAFIVGALALFALGLVEPYLNDTLGYLFNKAAIFPLSVGLTLALAIYYSTASPWGARFFSYIGQRSLGIYLGHFILVDPLRNVLNQDRALAALLVLLVCLAAKAVKDRTLQWMQTRSARVSAPN
jgi:surface polysaccharide O-acyltransferase-like enzyme